MLHIKLKRITQCSYMIVNICPQTPHLTLGIGPLGQNSTFSEHGHVAYQIKENHQIQQHSSKIFDRRPLPDPAVGVKSSKFNVFKHGHIKLKEITKCSSMVANNLPADPSLTLGIGSIGQNSTFSEHCQVTYQIKGTHLKKQHGSKYFAHKPLPDPAVWVKMSK